ncbi:hypothetical protein SADUNF_Sadunf09G0117500 [Salix dunnii]|uniref:A20-type domain-containing protein n=1 Tax=Salix dunnii TaxID=1413687 RepID=A0A835MWQ0_9ROSI|nr:hypothetical protein SADUNF_Sadunf09G0117500 [Salix dunnii]
MAEEQHRCQEPRLCVNNCGFFGNPTTQNLCSKCYGDLRQSQPLDQLLAQSSSASVSPSFTPPSVDVIKNQVGPVLMAKGDEKEEVKAEPTVVTPQQKPNRYPEQHGCEYDFKSSGKEQIAKANPVVKGEKLQKI